MHYALDPVSGISLKFMAGLEPEEIEDAYRLSRPGQEPGTQVFITADLTLMATDQWNLPYMRKNCGECFEYNSPDARDLTTPTLVVD